MIRTNSALATDSQFTANGSLLIAIGLAALTLAACVPSIPAVTAMAILSLGATNASLIRFRNSPAAMPPALLHLVTYAGLYALFIGATLHSASRHSAAGLSPWTLLDLAVSAVPMAIALQRTLTTLQQSNAPQR